MLVCKNLLLTFTSGPHSEMGGDAGNGEKDPWSKDQDGVPNLCRWDTPFLAQVPISGRMVSL